MKNDIGKKRELTERDREWSYWENLIEKFTKKDSKESPLPTAVFKELKEIEKKYIDPEENLEHYLQTKFVITENKEDKRPFYEVCKDLGVPEYFENSIMQKAEYILENEDVLEWMADRVQELHAEDRELSKCLYLSGLSACSRGYQEHVFSTGTSGKGKSALMGTVIELFPVHKRISLTSLTGKALYYLPEERKALLRNCILFLDEFSGSPEAIETIMAVTSNNLTKPRLWATGENKKGQRETRDLEIPENIVAWCAAIHPIKREEFMNRFTVINPSETKETDEKAIELTIRRSAYGLEREIPESYKIARAITQRLMEKEYSVLIPYVDSIKIDTQDRRIPKFIINLIKASAIAHQNKRYTYKDLTFAAVEDYQIAMKLWDKIKLQTTSKLSQKALEVYNLLPKEYPKEAEERRRCTEIYKKLENVSRKTVQRYLGNMYDLGLIEKEQEGTAYNSPYHYWRTGKSWTELDKPICPIVFDKKSLKSFLNDYISSWTKNKKEYIEILKEKTIDDIYSLSKKMTNSQTLGKEEKKSKEEKIGRTKKKRPNTSNSNLEKKGSIDSDEKSQKDKLQDLLKIIDDCDIVDGAAIKCIKEHATEKGMRPKWADKAIEEFLEREYICILDNGKYRVLTILEL